MQQWGLKGLTVTQVDDLRYAYEGGNSNRLKNVIDFKNDELTPLGDFKTSASSPFKGLKNDYVASNGTSDISTVVDYDYDDNGNLRLDKNKDISSITYNPLNLPEVITTPKGTITYSYDAAGNKLKKVVAETGKPVKTILYLVGTYENDVLQFLPQEEGRIRYKPENGGSFAWDYFIKDHLGNVRMVLTEEEKTTYYPAATLEGDPTDGVKSMVNHESKFYTFNKYFIVDKQYAYNQSNPPATTVLDYENNNGNPPYNSIASGSYPADYTVTENSVSNKVYKLNATFNITGLQMALKVMAGDHINIFGKSYYHSGGQTFSNNNSTQIVLKDLLDAFVTSAGSAAIQKGVSGSLLEASNSNTSIASDFIRGSNGETSSVPRAYINYIFFDEQFKYAGGGASRVSNNGGFKDHWQDNVLKNIEVPKNGYLYVYVSNESNVDVFFDNLQVVHATGPILEETHYYPFGLTMAGISSKAASFGGAENKKLFNNGSELQRKEFSDGNGLEWYATSFRGLDPQLGRWNQIDPLVEVHYDNSPYNYVLNNPLRYNDPLGLDTLRINGEGKHAIKVRQGDVLAWTIGEKTSYYTYDPKSKDAVNGFVGAGIDGGSLPEVTVSSKAPKNDFPSSFIGTSMMKAGAVGAIPIYKGLLPYLPKFIVGPYGRNFIKGSPFTSVASLTSRRLGLGGAFGRAFPVRATLIGFAWTGLEIHTRITTDKQFMEYYDQVQEGNPYKGYVIDGSNLIRIDYQKIEQQKQQYNENMKNNPYGGYVIDGFRLF